jgi:hypothetical protein
LSWFFPAAGTQDYSTQYPVAGSKQCINDNQLFEYEPLETGQSLEEGNAAAGQSKGGF